MPDVDVSSYRPFGGGPSVLDTANGFAGLANQVQQNRLLQTQVQSAKIGVARDQLKNIVDQLSSIQNLPVEQRGAAIAKGVKYGVSQGLFSSEQAAQILGDFPAYDPTLAKSDPAYAGKVQKQQDAWLGAEMSKVGEIDDYLARTAAITNFNTGQGTFTAPVNKTAPYSGAPLVNGQAGVFTPQTLTPGEQLQNGVPGDTTGNPFLTPRIEQGGPGGPAVAGGAAAAAATGAGAPPNRFGAAPGASYGAPAVATGPGASFGGPGSAAETPLAAPAATPALQPSPAAVAPPAPSGAASQGAIGPSSAGGVDLTSPTSVADQKPTAVQPGLNPAAAPQTATIAQGSQGNQAPTVPPDLPVRPGGPLTGAQLTSYNAGIARANDQSAAVSNSSVDISYLEQMSSLLDKFASGPDADFVNNGLESFNQLMQLLGGTGSDKVTDYTSAQNEFTKLAIRVANDSAQRTGTDQAQQYTMLASPNQYLSRGGNKALLATVLGQFKAAVTKNQVWQTIQGSGKNGISFQEFEKYWNQHANMQVFQAMEMDKNPDPQKGEPSDTSDFSRYLRSLPKAQQDQFVKDWNFMAANHWINAAPLGQR